MSKLIREKLYMLASAKAQVMAAEALLRIRRRSHP